MRTLQQRKPSTVSPGARHTAGAPHSKPHASTGTVALEHPQVAGKLAGRAAEADVAAVTQLAGEPLAAGRAMPAAPTSDGLWSMMPILEVGLWVFLVVFAVVPFLGIWVVCAVLTMGQGAAW